MSFQVVTAKTDGYVEADEENYRISYAKGLRVECAGRRQP